MPPIPTDQTLQFAITQHQAGDLPRAQILYRQILAIDPDHADALHLLGVTAHQTGDPAQAEQLITRALTLRPHWPAATSNLAIALKARADVLRTTGNLDSAIETYRRAIALKPAYAEAMNNLGVALQSSGQIPQAIAIYRQAIHLLPGLADAHNNLSVALRAIGHFPEAVQVAQQAIALAPTNSATAHNLALALIDAGQTDQAINACQRTITLNPTFAAAHYQLGKACIEAGDIAQAHHAFQQASILEPDNTSYDSATISTLHYQTHTNDSSIAEEHFRWNRRHAQPLAQFIQPHINDGTPNRRLKVGYVSPDIRQHPVGRFLLPLLQNHDHQSFEIFIYSDAVSPDILTTQARATADHWQDIATFTHEQLADQIRRDRIDLLIDLTGHTAGCRLLTFARKPAPVQITWLGYPATTGLTTIDYRLTDIHADPASQTDSHYSESLYRLPQTNWCFTEPKPSPEISPPPLLKTGCITFGSFNNFTKVTAHILTLWARILDQVPHSRLLLKSSAFSTQLAQQRARETLTTKGIDPARFTLLGPEPDHTSHLAIYNSIDIALDTYPYHGTATTTDALWMGVPAITLAGQSHVSRVGVSLLTNLDLQQWIATTPDQYIEKAVQLANDPNALISCRSTLRERMRNSSLMNAPQFTRNIETAYRQMWKHFCE